ncbi:PQQ-dependent sugar dehydrogenase [Streptomyces katsurahamanus]|uniref:PQQ-dependent sugar dehydrogenase n=1 Tax=Streptomyces katsurahamanus TaxID=2577098 RepID=A0ABW9NW97_9ACTN|nr:PQQ-dependent sugar dehydrogenase [Streptomyces katsurahamanus]MQS37596.1 PQQ-dependent sugar dehydrogenase [Streptomyces katsurahamanus]
MTAVLAAVAAVLAAGCSSDGGGGAPGATTSAPAPSPTASKSSPGPSAPPAKGSAKVVSTLTKGLNSPWGATALPDGDLLISSRDEGTITRVDAESGKKTEIGSVPGVSPGGEGGLMGLALSPGFASDRQLYAYFTTESDNRVARMLFDDRKATGKQLGAPDTILRDIPKGVIHNGGRIAFGPDKMLYAGTGETGETGLSQDPKSLGGKILRMTPDGRPAPDNPEPGSLVYSLGHRNVQGLAWDAENRLWASEFGQKTWDELNLIEPGKNYGWPEVEGRSDDSRFVNPVAQWRPDEASPSGIAYAKGSIWMAALRGERLWRIPLSGRELAARPQAFFKEEYGRLRTVLAVGGSGLWLVTSETDGRGTPEAGDDRILRLKVT